jgi:hypothetical protein
MISETIKHYPEFTKKYIEGKIKISGDFINEVTA